MCFLLHVQNKCRRVWKWEITTNLSFSYDNLNLEIVKHFNYLGIIFTRTGNFSLTKKHLADKALKAMYEVLKMGRMHKLSIKCYTPYS
jgi:hypothetical protein